MLLKMNFSATALKNSSKGIGLFQVSVFLLVCFLISFGKLKISNKSISSHLQIMA